MYLPLPNKITDILEEKAVQMQYGNLMHRKYVRITEHEDLTKYSQAYFLKRKLFTLLKENDYFKEQYEDACKEFDNLLNEFKEKYLNNIEFKNFMVDIDQEKIYYF